MEKSLGSEEGGEGGGRESTIVRFRLVSVKVKKNERKKRKKKKKNSIATTPLKERRKARGGGRGEGGRREEVGKGGTKGEKSEIDEALDPASSRMTIISGHWVDGAWRLSFAPYSYACPSCLSKPSLF